jgi:uncharacterized membrane protein
MAEDAEETGVEEGEEANGSNGSGALLSALKSKELLIPAALSAASAVAATKGPDLFRSLTQATEGKGEDEAERLGEKSAEGAKRALSGGKAGLAGKVASKAFGGGGGGGGKKTRRLPIQRWTDVAVPVEQAYEAWTAFDTFPRFMHRVLEVERKGNDKIGWQEKIWFSRRQWEGKITDRRKNDRIAWKTTSGMSHSGVVSFHPIAERLTRVMVTMEFEPNGMLEKMASGLRFVKRAVQADLARFKAYVEMEDAKGVEYRPVRDEDEESESKDGNGGAESRSRSADDDDDSERESERQERESRRQERREATSTG